MTAAAKPVSRKRDFNTVQSRVSRLSQEDGARLMAAHAKAARALALMHDNRTRLRAKAAEAAFAALVAQLTDSEGL